MEEAAYPDQEYGNKLRAEMTEIQATRLIAPIIGGELEESVKWIEKFTEKFKGNESEPNYDPNVTDFHDPGWGYGPNPNITYEMMMELAKETLISGDVIVQQGSEYWRSIFWEHRLEFWKHYEIVTREHVEDKR